MHRRQRLHRQTRPNFHTADHRRALRGITRSVVFEIAAETGIKVSETDIYPSRRFHCGRMFLTGTAAEIIPVVKADGRPIGTGKPGPITARMVARFREMTRETGTPITRKIDIGAKGARQTGSLNVLACNRSKV